MAQTIEYKGYEISELTGFRAFPVEVRTAHISYFVRRFKTVPAAKAAITRAEKTGYFA